LAERPRYQALSYVWGNHEKFYHAVVVDDHETPLGCLPLTTNLSNALHDLWSAEELTEKTFWIDQICIDQDTAAEKNHQVKMMDRIYESASRVITYLGPAEDLKLEMQGIRLLTKLDRHFAPNYDLLSAFDTLYTLRRHIAELPVTDLPITLIETTSRKTWTWLAEMALGQWTQRLWIVQEQLLNSEIIMLRGALLLSWEAVVVIPALFDLDFIPRDYLERVWDAQPAADAMTRWSIVNAIFSLWCSRRLTDFGTSGVRKLSLRDNLILYKYLQCEDPRDRVLALLSISTDADRLGIVPDYSQPVREFFLDVSVAILRHSHDLYFLSLVSKLDNLSEPHCPSWALDVPRPLSVRPTAMSWNPLAAHPYIQLRDPLRFESDNAVLVLKGRLVDSIDLSTPPMYGGFSSSTKSKADFWGRFLDVWSALSLDQGVTVQLADAFYRSLGISNLGLTTDRDTHLANLRDIYRLWCLLRYCAWYDFKMTASLDFGIGMRMVQYDRTITSLTALLVESGIQHPRLGDELNSRDYKLADNLANSAYITGRTFCVTKQRRICSGMNEVKVGDVLAIFQGAGALFVLRPVGTQYQLIGDAYVDGLMHGEAYEGLDPDEVDYDIELI
jgi:hypothetical protein